jgi:hypothetical protein
MNEIKTYRVWITDCEGTEFLTIKAANSNDAREIAERGLLGAYCELIEEEVQFGFYEDVD